MLIIDLNKSTISVRHNNFVEDKQSEYRVILLAAEAVIFSTSAMTMYLHILNLVGGRRWTRHSCLPLLLYTARLTRGHYYDLTLLVPHQYSSRRQLNTGM